MTNGTDMEQEFRLFPESASTISQEVDRLYWTLIGIAGFFTALICVLIVVFAIRYRQGAPVNREVRAGKGLVWAIEIGWIAIPLAIVIGIFVWGASLYARLYQPPAGALEVFVVGKQWMWKLQHEEGRREIDRLHVPVGQPVRLNMISEDVIHSFYIPAFRTKMDVLPGRYTSIWFEPSRPGEFHLFCAEYCGTGHSRMRGRVIAQTPDDYAEWIAEAQEEAPGMAGRRVLQKYGCLTCHGHVSAVQAPSFENLFGSRVPLRDGTSVVADAHYLRESILDPSAKVVAGFRADMPTFAGLISEEEIFQVIAYLRSLAGRSSPADEE